jgi:peroxiredoxin
MRRMTRVATVLMLASLAPLAIAAGTLPRPSPEFSIAEPGGPAVLLSSLRGKVVVMEFLFVKSAHCLRVASTLNKLYGELGSRGFQPVGVIFDPPNTPSSVGLFSTGIAASLKLSYPVGYTSKDDVDRYLGRGAAEILNIPQVVVIDRTGTIRAVSGGKGGDPTLEDENSLRVLIDALLQESAPAGSGNR